MAIRRAGWLEVGGERGGGGPHGLEFRLGELDFTGTHRQFDTWTARYEPFDSDFPMTFVTDAEGSVAEVVSPLEPLVAPIRFARRPV